MLRAGCSKSASLLALCAAAIGSRQPPRSTLRVRSSGWFARAARARCTMTARASELGRPAAGGFARALVVVVGTGPPAQQRKSHRFSLFASQQTTLCAPHHNTAYAAEPSARAPSAMATSSRSSLQASSGLSASPAHGPPVPLIPRAQPSQTQPNTTRLNRVEPQLRPIESQSVASRCLTRAAAKIA